MRQRWIRLVALMAGGTLALAGCGAKSPTAPPTPPTSSATAPAPVAPPPAAGPAHGLAFLDASHGWTLVDCGSAAAGTSPVAGDVACRLIATADGGKTWTQAARGLPSSARLQFFNAQDGFATVDGGTCPRGLCPAHVLATTDGGKSWTARYSGPVELASIDFSSPTAGWSIVDGGVDQSTDGGVRWHESVASAQAIGTACTMDFVRFSTSRAGVAGGKSAAGPCLATTTDGGATWKLSASQPIRAALADYAANMKFDANLQGMWQGGQACTAADAQLLADGAGWLYITCDPFNPGALAVMRTTDGGAAWHYVWGVAACLMGCHSDNGGMQPLFFLSGAAAWRVAPHGEQRTTDAGVTWTNGQALCGADPGCQVNLSFVSADTGWAITANGQAVYATRDGGKTWARQWP